MIEYESWNKRELRFDVVNRTDQAILISSIKGVAYFERKIAGETKET